MADAGIVRNRRKVDAAIANARATVALREQGGLEAFLWSFRPEPGPAPRTTADVPTTSPESVALSKALKKAGFALVGPTTMYALMEAIGLVDDHLEGCHRRGCAGSTLPRRQAGLRHTETWLSLSSVNGVPCQSATRRSSSIPASWAIRSHSAGQM